MQLSNFASLRSIRIHLPLHFVAGQDTLTASWSTLLLLLTKLQTVPLSEVSIHLYFSIARTVISEERTAQGTIIYHQKIDMMNGWESMLGWEKLVEVMKSFKLLTKLRIYIALQIDFSPPPPFFEPLEEEGFRGIKEVVEKNFKEFKKKNILEISRQRDNWSSLVIS